MQGFSLRVHQNKVESEIYFSEQYDNIHFKTEHFEFVLEGLILNKKKLLQEFAVSDFKNFIAERFHFRGIQFIDELEGEFRGFIHDFQKNRVFVFTNPTATQRVFYTKNESGIFVDSSLVRLNKTVKKSGISTKPDMDSLYQLLALGNMLENKTPIINVFKLLDGHYLEIILNKFFILEKKYFEISSERIYPENKSKALFDINECFSRVVKLEYEKDIEFKTKHFSLLSGGLDSRIAMFYAIKQNMKPNEVFCFSQSDYLDHKISSKIASDYHIPYRFVALDNGNFLKNIDKLTEISEGTNLYTGGIHTDFAFSKIDEDFNIIHSGQIGGEVMGGSYYESPFPCKPRFSRIVINQQFVKHIEESTNQTFQNYEREDLFLLRNWGFNKTVLGSQTSADLAIMTSPFMQKEFLNLIYSIPHHWKYNYQFYFEWFEKYCPEMKNYIWEKTFLKPDHFWKIKYGTKYIKPLTVSFFEKFSYKRTSMYPYQYYYDSSEEIQNYYQDYFNENFERISDYPELSNDVKTLFQSDKFTDKSLAVNVLSIFKLFFD